MVEAASGIDRQAQGLENELAGELHQHDDDSIDIDASPRRPLGRTKRRPERRSGAPRECGQEEVGATRHRPRKSPENGRNLALHTLRKKRKTLPRPTPPDPIERSVTSGAERQPGFFDQMRKGLRNFCKGYLPNALGDPTRAAGALVIEGARAVMGPRDAEPPIATEPETDLERVKFGLTTTDLNRVDGDLTAAPLSNIGSLVENAADAFYQVMETEFGSGVTDAPTNATQETFEEAQFKAAIAFPDNDPDKIVLQIDSLPTIEDSREPLSFHALTKRSEKEFRLYHEVPDTDFDRTIQGKIVILTSSDGNDFGVVRRLLEDVSRDGDILLRSSPLQYYIPGYGVDNEISLGENGMLVPNVVPAERQDCLGFRPSRCFIWNETPEIAYNAPDELALGMARTALLTIERHPELTVFVVTDPITEYNFKRSVRNSGGAAISLAQRAT